MISPNQLLAEAKKIMLGGREPKTLEDWFWVMNFMVINVDPKVLPEGAYLMRTIYDMPLTDEQIDKVITFQLAKTIVEVQCACCSTVHKIEIPTRNCVCPECRERRRK